MSCVRKVNIKKLHNGNKVELLDSIVVEKVLNLFVNNNFYASLMCTPSEVKELAAGFLFSENIICSPDGITNVEQRDEESICITLSYNLNNELRVRKAITSGCASGTIPLSSISEHGTNYIESEYKFKVESILAFMKEFNSKSDLFKETGGVHSCCLCDNDGLVYFSEDIGRHNAFDKIVGKALLDGVEFKDKLIMTTGRISSEIIIKATKAKIPIVVSHSASTDLALTIAKASNITVVGFVRGSKMNVYCCQHRILY